MTDPVRTTPSTWTRPLDTEKADTHEPSGCFRWGAFAFTVRIVRQVPEAFVTAMRGLSDRTASAILSFDPSRKSEKEGEPTYKHLRATGKERFIDCAAELRSCAMIGNMFESSLVFLESRSKEECGGAGSESPRWLREVAPQVLQNIAVAGGLPVVGGVIGIAYGLTAILTGLSTRRASRVTASASQTVLRRAQLARCALERLGPDKTLLAALLLESRYEYEGVPYGKTPHSAFQAELRWSAIAWHFPKGPPPQLVPRNRREKYEEYAANATEAAIQRATMLADRILTAIARNEVSAQKKTVADERAALVDIAMGIASVLFGVILIAFPLPVLPVLLALGGLYVLQVLLRHSTGQPEAADELLAEEIIDLLEDHRPSAALGRKFVKAVLRENGMDGAGLQALHFIEFYRDAWEFAWAKATPTFKDQFPRPQLHEHARSVVALQLRALLTGSSARDAVTHQRIVVREHPSEPPRKRAVIDRYIEDVP